MSEPLYDLCAIGNAMVDILIPADDAFLAANDVVKGAMTLVDAERSAQLYENAGAAAEMQSGGSAANTLAGFTSLGGRSAFMGKVGRDEFGDIFTHDLKAQNIRFTCATSPDLSTGRCLVIVTPDAQRSMNTFLGAASMFGPEDVDAEIVRASAITYLEGYLFDREPAQAAFRKAAKIAHDAGRKLSLTLSDTFCVQRHHEAFLELVSGEVDILFANEHELLTLYKTQDLSAAIEAVRAHTDIAVVTRGVKGAVIVAGAATHETPVHPAPSVIDTTGAGDLYAAGFLYGLTRNVSLPEAARIGAIAAAEVIGHYGPRPQKKLAGLI
ncbi:MAG: adenosine kinase [Alphaproteobacteria bacterium]|nr:adenosine kinase [Alphaproteobacteria bacterium]